MNANADTAPTGNSQTAAGDIAPVTGSSAAKLTMMVASATASSAAPGASTAPATPPRRRNAIGGRVDRLSRSSQRISTTAAPAATSTSGVSQTSPPIAL